MSGWQDFELECTDYLNDVFGDYATFYHEGGSDSTIPDIKVEINKNRIFYIDAKHCPAQCGQFVLLPDILTRTFEYSRLNVNKINAHAIKIIEFMNGDFNEFREAGTAGKDINMQNGSQIFSDWIIQTYKEKGARLFITNDFRIIDIDDFSRYFNVSAKYRIKRSGSSSIGKSRLSVISAYLKNNFRSISSIKTEGDKLFVTSSVDLHNTRFVYGEYEYMISDRGSKYEVRKLSNTYNANVIFSIDLKNGRPGLSDSEFINFLK